MVICRLCNLELNFPLPDLSPPVGWTRHLYLLKGRGTGITLVLFLANSGYKDK